MTRTIKLRGNVTESKRKPLSLNRIGAFTTEKNLPNYNFGRGWLHIMDVRRPFFYPSRITELLEVTKIYKTCEEIVNRHRQEVDCEINMTLRYYGGGYGTPCSYSIGLKGENIQNSADLEKLISIAEEMKRI